MNWGEFSELRPYEAQRFIEAGDWTSTDDEPEDFVFVIEVHGSIVAFGRRPYVSYRYSTENEDWDFIS